MALKKCTTSFTAKGKDGRKRFVHAGDLLEDTDEVVKALPKFFEDVAATNKPRREEKKAPTVEQATAAPGEVRRGPGRPPKAKKEDDR